MHIENVLGIKEFDLDAGQITEISGRNAEGKTSVLTAIKTAIGGGSLKELKNINCDEEDKARIVLSLQDESGTNFVLDKTETSLKLKKQVGDSAAFETVGRPQQFLNSIRDCKLGNPIDFLNAKNDKERTELILQAVDLPFSRDELWSIIGFPREQFGYLADGMNPLEEISQTRQLVFDKRTGVNTSRRDKRAACEEYRLSVPAEIPTVDGISEKEKQLSELRVKRQKINDDINYELDFSLDKASLAMDAAQSKHDNSISDYENELAIELSTAIQKMKAEMAEKLSAKRFVAGELLKSETALAVESENRAQEKHRLAYREMENILPEIERLHSEISAMREQEKNAIRIKTIHDQADKMEYEADELDLLAGRLTDSLKAIDEYKASLSSKLPVEGLDVTNNVVSINGIPWSQLNTAQRIIAAVKIIAARAKKYEFKFVMVDGVEQLDSESRKILSQTLIENGIQAVLGRVSDTYLEVTK